MFYGKSPKKKLLRRRHWSILIYPPPSLAWMGQEEWGHKKLFTDPLPPSCNRDKLQFSGGELINTIWPLLIFPAKSSTLLHDIENLHYVRPQKMLQIVWKQKHQREHGTCDKKILTPPSIRICPLFGELKKGDYFYPPPSHMDQCLLLSNFFFLNASLIDILENLKGGKLNVSVF